MMMDRAAAQLGNNESTERRERVERNLLPPVVLRGHTTSSHTIAQRMRQFCVPGLGLAVIHNGNLDWTGGYGLTQSAGLPVSAQTPFQAAWISTAVTALAAMRLVDRGFLKLDADIRNYLKSWRFPENEFTAGTDVTLRQVLSHSAGFNLHSFSGYRLGEPLPTLLQILNGQNPANNAAIQIEARSGEKSIYSSGGFAVLHQLLIDVTGESFPEFMRASILEPLGMVRSTFQQSLPEALRADAAFPHRADGEPIEDGPWVFPEAAAAGLWTTAEDLARLIVEIQSALNGHGRVLSPDAATRMISPQKPPWGLGFRVEGTGNLQRYLFASANDGYRCMISCYPETGDGFAAMTNSNSGDRVIGEIFASLGREYAWPGDSFAPREKTIVELPETLLQELAGSFDMGNRKMEVRLRNGRLISRVKGEDHELYAESPTQFFAMDEPLELTALRDQAGRMIGWRISAWGQSMEARRVP